MERQRTRETTDFNPSDYDYDDPESNPADLDRFYGSLENYVKMVAKGHSNLLMLDAKGGLGKTYNTRRVLSNEMRDNKWRHLKGFTTPVELYRTLWESRADGAVLFLDDMSGITSNTKAIDMLKSATDTNGPENWVEYRSSQGIDHPSIEDAELPQTFNFGGRIIMSFNDTPDNPHFDALKDRGHFYQLSFSYRERLSLIREVAKLSHFSPLSVEEQQECAEWIASVTNEAMSVTIRTFEHVCDMRHFGQQEDENWERMALEVFNIDYAKYLIIRLREESDMSVEKQVEYFKEKTGKSQGTYYDLLSEIKNERMT